MIRNGQQPSAGNSYRRSCRRKIRGCQQEPLTRFAVGKGLPKENGDHGSHGGPRRIFHIGPKSHADLLPRWRSAPWCAVVHRKSLKMFKAARRTLGDGPWLEPFGPSVTSPEELCFSCAFSCTDPLFAPSLLHGGSRWILLDCHRPHDGCSTMMSARLGHPFEYIWLRCASCRLQRRSRSATSVLLQHGQNGSAPSTASTGCWQQWRELPTLVDGGDSGQRVLTDRFSVR